MSAPLQLTRASAPGIPSVHGERRARPGNHRLFGVLALLLPAMSAGQAIDVDRGDLYLRGGKLASGDWGCGFAILANHRTREDPHIEWDINVEQVNNGIKITTSVSAASFIVTHKTRAARELTGPVSFVIDQDPAPILLRPADGVPLDRTVQGYLGSEDALRLFTAIGAGSFVTILVGAQEAAVESLRFHLARDSAGPAQGAFAELCRPAASAPR